MNSVIIVFLKAPHPGRVKTRLAKVVGDEEAARIYRLLVVKVGEQLAQCEGADLCFYYTPTEGLEVIQDWLRVYPWSAKIRHWRAQPEGDLGDRQAAATRWAEERGYAKVALVGTDCITLTPQVLQAAWDGLDDHDWVFGPSKDGGYYLAATRTGEDTSLFQGVRWSSRHTLDDCLAKMAPKRVLFLEAMEDVDEYDDWRSVQEPLDIKNHAAKPTD